MEMDVMAIMKVSHQPKQILKYRIEKIMRANIAQDNIKEKIVCEEEQRSPKYVNNLFKYKKYHYFLPTDLLYMLQSC